MGPCQPESVLADPSQEESLTAQMLKPELGKTEYTMPLTPEQLEKGGRITYSILEQKQEGEYLVLMHTTLICRHVDGI